MAIRHDEKTQPTADAPEARAGRRHFWRRSFYVAKKRAECCNEWEGESTNMTDTSHTPDRALATHIRTAAHELMIQIMGYFREQRQTINEIIVVPLTILARIIRSHDAIELLVKNNHPSEAAVLLLTQFELRFALAVTASDINEATQWIEHEDMTKLSQNMRARIDQLYQSDADRVRVYSIFRLLSGVKHGNPAYSELGFPARAAGGSIVVSTGDIEDDFAEQFGKMILAYSVYQLAWSTQVIHKFTGQYAKIERSVREKVQDSYKRTLPFETEFLLFLQDVVNRQGSYLGLKKARVKPVAGP